MRYISLHMGHMLPLKRVNSLPNNKILDWSKLKAFTDDKLHVAGMIVSIIKYKTMWGKENMLITSIFSFSHNVFKSSLFQGH